MIQDSGQQAVEFQGTRLLGFKSIRLFEFPFFVSVSLRWNLPPVRPSFKKVRHIREILV